jgi:hypothetical protein
MAHGQHQTANAERGVPKGSALRVPRSAFAVALRATLAFAIIFCPRAQPAEEIQLSEYQVKAALLLNFVRYTGWPATAFANTNSHYVVAITGRDPFGKDLEKAFDGKTVKGRTIVLKRVSNEQEMRACHLLFVSASERRRSRDLLRKIQGLPVLTVGESPDFLDESGVINLVLKDGSVRFHINLEPARIARLKLDANLLAAALSVRGKL